MIYVNSFDIDGVIYLGDYDGVYPGPQDIIITGRSFEERSETEIMLNKKKIRNLVFYNPLKFDEKTRESSGVHKAQTMLKLKNEGIQVRIHFEDDPIQIAVIKELVTFVTIVHLDHNLVEKENVRHIL